MLLTLPSARLWARSPQHTGIQAGMLQCGWAHCNRGDKSPARPKGLTSPTPPGSCFPAAFLGHLLLALCHRISVSILEENTEHRLFIPFYFSRTFKHWNRLPREAGESQSLQVFKTSLHHVLNKLMWFQCWPWSEQELALENLLKSIPTEWFHDSEEEAFQSLPSILSLDFPYTCVVLGWCQK